MFKNKSATATTLLFIGMVFWGGTFVLVKEAVARIDVYSLIFIRFLIASLLLGAIFIGKFRGLTVKIIWRGVAIGSVLAVSFILQTIGLKYTSASSSAFITGLSVVLVPLYLSVIDRKLPGRMQLVSTVMAVVGLALLTIKLPFRVNAGDLWTLLSAATYGAQIVLIARFMGSVEPGMFNIVQLATVALATGACGMAANGGITIPTDPVVWRAIIYCALPATAYIFAVQAFFQKYISEIKATIIYSLEPVFAAIIAFLVAGERMTVPAIVGAALIFAGMIVADLKPSGRRLPD